MARTRKHYTPEEKVSILRRHLIDQVPISQLCDELGLQPTIFYRWQKTFFENGSFAFKNTDKKVKTLSDKKITALEAKLQTKNEVLSELMEEHVALKKSLGVI